jgi:hypothetical protein
MMMFRSQRRSCAGKGEKQVQYRNDARETNPALMTQQSSRVEIQLDSNMIAITSTKYRVRTIVENIIIIW